ncbi:MAG: nucleoside 2-deoxyribosyltransferase [Deltaproteobacteria bacterium]|jgi:nucleoside 2-deoxyribosyltransferase|nr:nucleoside 2-deoxyribosyltransferase [Deltaproteobacteria bacterium]
MPHIYFAGPDIFRKDYSDIKRQIKDLCKSTPIIPLIPGDDGITKKPKDKAGKRDLAREIYNINLEHIQKADGVIANLSPFRGVIEPDSGTAFEVGYAAGLGKWVVGYLSDLRDLTLKIKDSPLKPLRGGLTDLNGVKVEDMGYPVNLMLACACSKLVRSLEEAVGIVLKGLKVGSML